MKEVEYGNIWNKLPERLQRAGLRDAGWPTAAKYRKSFRWEGLTSEQQEGIRLNWSALVDDRLVGRENF